MRHFLIKVLMWLWVEVKFVYYCNPILVWVLAYLILSEHEAKGINKKRKEVKQC